MPRIKRDYTVWKIVLGIVVLAGICFAGVKVFRSTGSHLLPQSADSSVSSQDSLARAQELYTQGNFSGARDTLEPLVKAGDDAVAPQALIQLARVQRALGDKAAEAKSAERAYKDFPSSPQHQAAAVAYAQTLEEAGNAAAAIPIYEEVRNSAPPEMRAPALVCLGRAAEKKNDLIAARDLYRKAVDDAAWDSDSWADAVEALGRVNATLIFSPTPVPESKKYTIQKGDSITSIGNALNTTQGLLTRANGITETTRLSLGQQLKYTPKDFRIIIERSKCRLFLVDKDGLFKAYVVGLGKPGHETTLGSFKIGNKEKDPVWHKPGEGPIPAGDPRNELGTRWMPLVPDQEGLPRDLGIHGTIRPETVGKYTSNGCARLFPGQIEELYDLVVRATPVDIVETCTKDMIAPAK